MVADDSGLSWPFRDSLAERGLHHMVVFNEPPSWTGPKPATGGRPQKRRRPDDSPRPFGPKALVGRMPWHEGIRRERDEVGRKGTRTR